LVLFPGARFYTLQAIQPVHILLQCYSECIPGVYAFWVGYGTVSVVWRTTFAFVVYHSLLLRTPRLEVIPSLLLLLLLLPLLPTTCISDGDSGTFVTR
jgi:hypothetical protein